MSFRYRVRLYTKLFVIDYNEELQELLHNLENKYKGGRGNIFY